MQIALDQRWPMACSGPPRHGRLDRFDSLAEHHVVIDLFLDEMADVFREPRRVVQVIQPCQKATASPWLL